MESKSDVCPCCGYCKHCGRGGHHVVPLSIYPYPKPWWNPYQPTWGGNVSTGTITTGSPNGTSVTYDIGNNISLTN